MEYIQLGTFILSAVTAWVVAWDKFANRRHTPDETPDVREEELDSLSDSNKEFDRRIMQIKDELAKQIPVKHSTSEATELHPDVKNLPHDNITYNTKPDFEYAD